MQLAIGYGVLFGAGGGAGYILVQQAVNLAVTQRHGLVNGYIVSLYPAGAMIAAPLFGWAVRELGVRATLGGLAAVLAVTGLDQRVADRAVRRHARGGRRRAPRRRRTSGAGRCSGGSGSSSSWRPRRG